MHPAQPLFFRFQRREAREGGELLIGIHRVDEDGGGGQAVVMEMVRVVSSSN